MSKKFLISEDDRQSILSLYKSKGIIFEEDRTSSKESNTPSESVKIYKTPFFANSRLNIKMSGNKLFYINPNDNSEKDINGNHTELFVNLLNGNIMDAGFVANQQTVKNAGGFGSIRIKEDRPTNTDGNFQLIMINYPNSNASASIPQNEPSLCTVRIEMKQISLISGRGIKGASLRVESDSPEINLLQFYIPKNKGEWESIKSNVWTSRSGIENISFKDFKNGGYAIYLSPYWAQTSLGEVTTTTPTPPPKDRFVPRNIGGANGDPFKFNKTDLSGIGDELLKKFIDQFIVIKNSNPNLYNTYIDFLKKRTNSIDVVAYASIDEDPEQVVNYVVGTNAVEGCGGRQKRHDYNQCLSQKRADKIAAILNEKLPDFPDFIGKGLGETDKFAPGKKWPKSSREETLPNRRFDVVLPYYEDYVPEK